MKQSWKLQPKVLMNSQRMWIQKEESSNLSQDILNQNIIGGGNCEEKH